MSRSLNNYVKVLLTYDIIPEVRDEYYQFMLGEMVPRAETLGLDMVEAWHTAVGNYPVRLVSFIIESREAADTALASPDWQAMEEELQRFVVNYRCRVVPLRGGFQF